MRYGQLVELVSKYKPRSIVEIGVHRGARSAAMMAEAMRYGEVVYVGYDVFDTKDRSFHEAAFNKKGIARERDAEAALLGVGVPKGAFSFVVGDTSETLHGKNVCADFVFIDGDHRVEVIAGDYEAVKSSKVVVFDDYYTEGPDIDRVGCNKVLEGLDFELLPEKDAVSGGGYTQLAVVRK